MRKASMTGEDGALYALPLSLARKDSNSLAIVQAVMLSLKCTSQDALLHECRK